MREDIIAIVGGGASGALVALHMLREADRPLTIVLIEREGRPGQGAAYGTTDSGHVLNVPAGKMSAIPEQPDHFLRWLGDPNITGLDFVPRRLYGRYLGEQLEAAARQAAPGVTLRRIHGEVVAVDPHIFGARIDLRSGESFDAARVVLALGNAPSAGVTVLDDSRYVRDPWAPRALDNLPRGPILLVGSGLTMVDVVLSLVQRGHAGPFLTVSRHGLLPGAHVVPPQHAATAAVATPRGLRSLVRVVRSAIAASNGGWRGVVDGLRQDTQALWRGLSHDDKRRFLRHVRPYWDTARHRMAPRVASRIDELERAGVLISGAARVLDVASEHAALRVTLRVRGRDQAESLDVAAVVNCTGPGESHDNPLMTGLLREGHARRTPIGLGFDTADDGALIAAHGRPSTVLFTLGPPRKGNLWETTAIPEIRAQARALATALVASATSDDLRVAGAISARR